MDTIATFNRENITDEDLQNFRHRRATRGVIVDRDSNIAIFHVVNQGWYGLPGGALEEGENFEEGILRKCKEEIGCNIIITAVLGRAIEYRKKDFLLNETYGYIGTVNGEKGVPQINMDEEENSEIIWVTLPKAIELLSTVPQSDNLYKQYPIERDLVFLKKAQAELTL